MSDFQFPAEILSYSAPSYETLHHYARALSAVRRALTPKQRHWSHVSLQVSGTGLTTTPIPYRGQTFEMALDLASHRLLISTSRGKHLELRLRGQTLAQFWQDITSGLKALDIQSGATKPDYPDAPAQYAIGQIDKYWRALAQVDVLLKQFQGELRGGTGPVQFWSHHFDLAMLWFSGRLVPGKDPQDEENADEQMNFGFSAGDAGIAEPYFYVTAYPLPYGLAGLPLPGGAYWHTEGWTGAVLPYKVLAASDRPDELLLEYWRTVHQYGAERMK